MADCQDVQSQLSLFVDGELTGAPLETVTAHLSTCAACRGVAADLARITATARTLEPITPPAGVWAALAPQVRTASAAPRAPMSPWIAIAASLVLIAAAAYVALHVSRNETPAPAQVTAGNANASPSVELLSEEMKQAETHYVNAIAQLDAIVSANTAALDPVVKQVLQTNLPAIDQAIAESRAALGTEPGSAVARESLFEALRSKVSVLQDTVALMR